MYVAHGEPPFSRDNFALLNGELPTLTARAVGTVIRAAATNKKFWIGWNVDVRLVGAFCDVIKRVRAEGAVRIEALGERGRRERERERERERGGERERECKGIVAH